MAVERHRECHAGRSLTWPYLQSRIRILMELSQRSRDIIDFERTWRALPGTKAQAIRERFGLSDSRYYQLLNDILDEPGVAAYDPLVVKRLRRRRDRRRRARFDRQNRGAATRPRADRRPPRAAAPARTPGGHAHLLGPGGRSLV